MPSAASVKVEKPPTTNNSAIMAAATANVVVAGEIVDNSSPVRQIAVLVEHKIRNLEKRKVSEAAKRYCSSIHIAKQKKNTHRQFTLNCGGRAKRFLKNQMARPKKTIQRMMCICEPMCRMSQISTKSAKYTAEPSRFNRVLNKSNRLFLVRLFDSSFF